MFLHFVLFAAFLSPYAIASHDEVRDFLGKHVSPKNEEIQSGAASLENIVDLNFPRAATKKIFDTKDQFTADLATEGKWVVPEVKNIQRLKEEMMKWADNARGQHHHILDTTDSSMMHQGTAESVVKRAGIFSNPMIYKGGEADARETAERFRWAPLLSK